MRGPVLGLGVASQPAMGNSTSRVVGCFAPADKADVPCAMFLEPLDEGLGHSLCYVRPRGITDSPVITASNSERYMLDSSVLDSETCNGSFQQEVIDDVALSIFLIRNYISVSVIFKTCTDVGLTRHRCRLICAGC